MARIERGRRDHVTLHEAAASPRGDRAGGGPEVRPAGWTPFRPTCCGERLRLTDPWRAGHRCVVPAGAPRPRRARSGGRASVPVSRHGGSQMTLGSTRRLLGRPFVNCGVAHLGVMTLLAGGGGANATLLMDEVDFIACISAIDPRCRGFSTTNMTGLPSSWWRRCSTRRRAMPPRRSQPRTGPRTNARRFCSGRLKCLAGPVLRRLCRKGGRAVSTGATSPSTPLRSWAALDKARHYYEPDYLAGRAVQPAHRHATRASPTSASRSPSLRPTTRRAWPRRGRPRPARPRRHGGRARRRARRLRRRPGG